MTSDSRKSKGRGTAPSSLENCMIRDRFGLDKMRQKIASRRRQGKAVDRLLSDLEQRVRASEAMAGRRAASVPEVSFPEALPVSRHIEALSAAIEKHQVVVVSGETGSGKSTQLPKLCLAMGRGIYGRIGHTQPRRMAARTLAYRVSEELKSKPGDVVGYRVRFHDHVSDNTHVKLMTDGMLLAEIQGDRYLNEYDTLIIDEAHERSLNIDFLLGYLKNLLPRRPDLKLVITSATIDTERFSKHFDSAPVVHVSGRTWPVEVRYREGIDASDERDESVQLAIVDALDELATEPHGDVLVFLSGEKEIRETAETLRKHRMKDTEVLPLYARLNIAEQNRVFQPHRGRRVVLATNVAETSLTVPGIRYVIDPGFARISRYSARSKVQQLRVESISQASANQRKGRCGRVAEGVCIRLFSEQAFDKRRAFTDPEIQRTNLASVILRMKLSRLGEIEDFPFLDKPDQRQINDGYRLLQELQALDSNKNLTEMGRKIAQLPLDPRLARMLVESVHQHCLREMLVIVSALSVTDPRERPAEHRSAADQVHARFSARDSDFLAYLNLWGHLTEQKKHLSNSKFKSMCSADFLSGQRVREWFDLHQQLHGQMHELGHRENESDASYEQIHCAILSGLITHIGHLGREKNYQGVRGAKFDIFPGSVLAGKTPKWIMAADRVLTTRNWGRTVARIQPEWIRRAAAHLVQHEYFEPHWQPAIRHVAAYRRTTLYGLTLKARERVDYGPVNPDDARDIFIRHALVNLDLETRAPFYRHNRQLIESLRYLEARQRSYDALLDEDRIYRFYSERVPLAVNNGPALERWLKKIGKGQAKRLFMTSEDICRVVPDENLDQQFPEEIDFDGIELPLEYHFEPGSDTDGVTLKVPVSMLGQVTSDRAEWLIPGLLQEKVTAMLRALPKNQRKQLVPIPDTVSACLEKLDFGRGSLKTQLAETIQRVTESYVSEDAWNEQVLDDHMRMNIQVLDDNGKELAHGRDLGRLKQQYAGYSAGKAAIDGIERDAITRWDFGVLPAEMKVRRSGMTVTAFPALIDCGQSVSLKILESRQLAEKRHRAGLRRLFMLAMPKQVRALKRNIPRLDELKLSYSLAPADSQDAPLDLEDEIMALAFERAFMEDRKWPEDQATFEMVIEENSMRLGEFVQQAGELASQILKAYRTVRQQLAAITQKNWQRAVDDMTTQLDQLVYRGFLVQTPPDRRTHLPRYLRAIDKRLEKLPLAAARDSRLMDEMALIQSQWTDRLKTAREKSEHDPRLEVIRWELEELRVSLFAQELGTIRPISVKRIQKHWQELYL